MSPTLNQVARELWQWCERYKIFVLASHIPSADNWRADRESRRENPDTEVKLSALAFDRVARSFGLLDIDLFAFRIDFKCPVYFSWFPNPNAAGVDAFTFSWAGISLYAFPPFCLVLQVLQKIRSDQAEGILIVPNWPVQSWFPLFLDLLAAEPLYLSTEDLVFPSSLHRTQHLPSQVAGRVSSWCFGTRGSRKRHGRSI